MSELFKDEDDLLAEFGQFLPDCTAHFSGVSLLYRIDDTIVCPHICITTLCQYIDFGCGQMCNLCFNYSLSNPQRTSTQPADSRGDIQVS